MTELDFDELDKAVNSLMGDKGTPKQPETTPAPVTPAAVPETPSLSSPSSSIVPPVTSGAARVTPPAARRGGRFMDVVPVARKETVSPVSRQGIAVQPSSDSMSSATVAPPKPTGIVSPSPKGEPAPVIPQVSTDWPDPLELAGAKGADTIPQDTASSAVSPAEASASVEETEPKNISSVQEPLSSPFLPDAKVEKRPLGGTGELMVEDENAQLPALPKDVEPALPEELHGDVVSIEADNSTTDPSKHVVAHENAEAVSEAKDKDVPLKPKTPEVTVTEAVTSVGPVSIPQQYKEEPSSGDQKNGAIYDTDSYHQPLSHPAKKKSGWSWVLWILVILLVGAGGGAALYFLGIF